MAKDDWRKRMDEQERFVVRIMIGAFVAFTLSVLVLAYLQMQ